MKRAALFTTVGCIFGLHTALAQTTTVPSAGSPSIDRPESTGVHRTFTVNSAYDEPDLNHGDGACNSNWYCTLRAAIEEANASDAGDTITIEFDIEHYPPGYWTGRAWLIKPASPLPVLTHWNVTIDASTQPGSDCRTLNEGEEHLLWIELDGSSSGGSPGNGLTITGGGAVIRGMVINGHDWAGIRSYGDDLTIECSYIGTDVTGTVDKGNGIRGVYLVEGANVSILNSLISGNGGSGIVIAWQVSDALIQGNVIGADVISYDPLPNDEAGITDYGVLTTIGGQPGYHSASSNIIAHNAGDGIRVMHDQCLTSMLGNSMFGNGTTGFDLGIDLGDDGITGNDPLDGDPGPNGLQNFPHKFSATYLGGTRLDIEIVLWTEPNKAYVVEIFEVTEAGVSGHGEGRTPLLAVGGQVSSATGYIYIRFPVEKESGWLPRPMLTATATRMDPGRYGYGPTSEYTIATPTRAPNLTLYGKIFLEGAYNGGVMSTSSEFATSLPLTNPYADAVYNGTRLDYGAWDAVADIPAGAVDWVLYTLRRSDESNPDLPGEIETRKAAFVGADGRFMDLDGTYGIGLYAPSGPGSYWIEVGHRNHIGIISSTDFSFATGFASINFSGAMALAYSVDGSPMANMGTDVFGPFALFACDTNIDGYVNTADIDAYSTAASSAVTGYQMADCNFDGRVQSLDANLILANDAAGASSQIP